MWGLWVDRIHRYSKNKMELTAGEYVLVGVTRAR